MAQHRIQFSWLSRIWVSMCSFESANEGEDEEDEDEDEEADAKDDE